AKTSESIRKKHRALKTGKIDDDIAVTTHFRPIIEPLQKIVDNSIAVKNEPESNTDVKIKTLPIKRYKEDEKEEEEEEEAPKKRKRLNANWDIPRVRNILKPLNASLHELPITSTPLTSPRSVQPMIPKTLVNENVFETTGNTFETSVRNRLESPEGQEMLREHLGPLGHKYIGALLGGDKKHEIDHVYGVYFDKNEMMLGNKRFDVDKDDAVIIDNVRYIGTPGLYELIFKRIPDDIIYVGDDLQKYKSILLATNTHKRNYDAQGHLRSNRGYKYKQIIAPLMSIEPKKPKSGRGVSMPRAMTLPNDKIDYVHWDDPNELVDRLRLLDASRQAGHNAHDNEILSIIEELREAGIIIN
ncbi:hypothetical protein RF55_16813, partial [Lasius niger]